MKNTLLYTQLLSGLLGVLLIFSLLVNQCDCISFSWRQNLVSYLLLHKPVIRLSRVEIELYMTLMQENG